MKNTRGHFLIFSPVLLMGMFLFFGSMLIGVSDANAALVTCGTGKSMCTLCNLIEGMNVVIQYLMKLSIGVALLAMTIGGVMYIVSAGDSGLTDQAKGTIKNAAIGFAIIFAGWLIINTTISYLGTKPGMGIGITSWGQFNCNRVEPIPNSASANASSSVVSSKDCKTKSLKSLEVQCENGPTDSISLASTATTDKPSIYNLKAMATYDCTDSGGATSKIQEDVTQGATWKAIDETIAKADKGVIKATGSGDTPVKVSFNDQSTSVGIFVDSCPLSKKTASTGGMNILSNNKISDIFSLLPQSAQAADCVACGGKTGAKPSCEFVVGNKDAKYVFILARANGISPSPCSAKFPAQTWKEGDSKQVALFEKGVVDMSGDLVYVGDLASNFAIYKSNNIYAGSDLYNSIKPETDCFWNEKGNISRRVMAGYIELASDESLFSDSRAYASRGSRAFFCSNEGTKQKTLLAHELIGHAFALLGDEYVEAGKTQPTILYNCTKDISCKKWQSIEGKSLGGCFKGCEYSSSYYRSSQGSIMVSPKFPEFSPLQMYLIKYAIEHDQEMIESLKETK